VRGLPHLYHYQVIIWLNGTFGVGKSSTAERLAALVPGSRVLDPESVGQLLRVNLSDLLPVSDFQDWAAWRPLVAATLIEVARMTGQHLIAPMTVLKREYLDQIFEPVRAADLDVFHVVLDASDTVLRSRIELTQDGQEWRLAHLGDYGQARGWMTAGADFVVDTAASTPAQIARKIFAALPDMPDRAAKPVVAAARPAVNGTASAAGKAGHEVSASATATAPSGKAAADKAPADKAAPDKAAADKAVPDKAAADKAAADKGPADKAVPDKGPADKAVPDKGPADKAVPDKAPADKAVPDKAAADKVVAGKAPADRAPADNGIADTGTAAKPPAGKAAVAESPAAG
jgi:hypothetical protein